MLKLLNELARCEMLIKVTFYLLFLNHEVALSNLP